MDKQVLKLGARILENLPVMSPVLVQEWIDNPKLLQNFLQGLVLKSPTHLRHLQSLPLAPTSDIVTIAASRDVFTGYIDLNFKSWGSKARVETLDTTVEVFEMTKDGQYKDLFGSLTTDPRRLTLTEGQIVEFCRTHRKHLRQDGYGTFFLYEGKNKELFVAYVSVDGGQLKVYVRRFVYDNVWHAGYRHRLVVKQQTV